MYTIRNNRIFEIDKQIRPSKRGTAIWCKLIGYNKYYLVSCLNMYDSYKQTMLVLTNKNK